MTPENLGEQGITGTIGVQKNSLGSFFVCRRFITALNCYENLLRFFPKTWKTGKKNHVILIMVIDCLKGPYISHILHRFIGASKTVQINSSLVDGHTLPSCLLSLSVVKMQWRWCLISSALFNPIMIFRRFNLPQTGKMSLHTQKFDPELFWQPLLINLFKCGPPFCR